MGYPYVENSHGIPFFQMKEGEELVLISGSGTVLSYNATLSELFVCATDNGSQTELYAGVDKGLLKFSLYPRKTIHEISGYHPDMFATKFIDVALRYFEDRQVSIGGCFADWYGGTNHTEYHALKDGSKGRVFAANNTWMGRKLIERGFETARDEDILEKKSGVFVNFKKP